MKTLSILNDAPYGSERTYNALRLAGSLSRKEGTEVTMFLIGDAVASAKAGQKVPQGYYNVANMVGILLVAIPPHRGPRLVGDAGLANEAGWAPVDRRTLATKHERVYAIGDVTAIPIPGRWKPDVPLMLPKAGVFAHDQARVVARRIVADITGAGTGPDFCGDGYCMLEAGDDLAGFAHGNFFGEPSPEVRLQHVGKAWHLGKVLFERWWLAPFGARRRALQLALEWGGRAYGVRVAL